RIDGIDLCVRVRAAQNHRLEHAGQSEVIRIETSARDVTGTFFAAGTTADELSHSSFLLPRLLPRRQSAHSRCTYKDCRPMLCEFALQTGRDCFAATRG